MTEAALPAAASQRDILEAQVESAVCYAQAAKSGSTARAYAPDWRIFCEWCDGHGLESVPARPPAVATFLAAEADRGIKAPTIGRRLAAIGHHHRQAGFDPPQEHNGAGFIREVLSGIRCSLGVRTERKRPADADALGAMLATISGEDLRALRDRALLAIGMAAALRRSELVGFHVEDIELHPEGLRLLVGRSKTDQAGGGVVIAVPEGPRIKPKSLLLSWMGVGGHDTGPLFRRLSRGGAITSEAMSDRAVARLVQHCASDAGLDPAHYAGHSQRSGFLTEVTRQVASIFTMREVSRHKSLQVLSDYVRDVELFRDHAGGAFL